MTEGRVLIAGVSTRAAAESAARAGFDVTAIDAFGDLDQHPVVRARSLPGTFTARAAADAVRDVECDAVIYLSPFENHRAAVRTLAVNRALWGNAPDVLARVRDPIVVADTLRARGFAVPDVRGFAGPGVGGAAGPVVRSADLSAFANATADRRSLGGGWSGPRSAALKGPPDSEPSSSWLLKPLASGGGHRIRRWHEGDDVRRGWYLQEFIDGAPGSVVFVAANGRAVPLGVFRQLIGDNAFGASGFQYCGNVLATSGDSERDEVVERACDLARAVAGAFNLVGVNGLDFVARDGMPYAVEVNPRWCASMELVERAYGISVFGAHAAACGAGTLPDFDVVRARRAARGTFGKAIVFAREDAVAGDTRAWLTRFPSRDIPHPGTHISAGRPVCTVFADGPDAAACYSALAALAARVYADLRPGVC